MDIKWWENVQVLGVFCEGEGGVGGKTGFDRGNEDDIRFRRPVEKQMWLIIKGAQR